MYLETILNIPKSAGYVGLNKNIIISVGGADEVAKFVFY